MTVEEVPRSTEAHSAVLIVTGLVITILNLIVVVSSGLIMKTGFEPLVTRCTYLLLGNVALAGMITGCCIFAGAIYPKREEARSHIGCILFIGLFISSLLLSAYSVMLIAVDRYLYIMHGLKYSQMMFVRKIRWAISTSWILSLLVGFSPFPWAHESLEGKKCWFVVVIPRQFIIFAIVIILIPIKSVCIMHCIILRKAVKKVNQLNNQQTTKTKVTSDVELGYFRGTHEQANV